MAFSLRTLFAGIAFIALFAVALFYANRYWIDTLTTIVVGLLVTSIVCAVHCPFPRQTFWNGFAIVGWTYYLLTSNAIELIGQHRFLTTAALDAIHPLIAREERVGREPDEPRSATIVGRTKGGSPIYAQPVPRLESFEQVGELFFTTIFALLGGLLAVRVRVKSRDGPAF
jgi:hypothetical protein